MHALTVNAPWAKSTMLWLTCLRQFVLAWNLLLCLDREHVSFQRFKAVSGSICLSVITNAYMHARSTDGPTLFSAGRPCYVLRFFMVGVAGAGLAVVRFRPSFFLAGACSKSNSPSKPATK